MNVEFRLTSVNLYINRFIMIAKAIEIELFSSGEGTARVINERSPKRFDPFKLHINKRLHPF